MIIKTSQKNWSLSNAGYDKRPQITGDYQLISFKVNNNVLAVVLSEMSPVVNCIKICSTLLRLVLEPHASYWLYTVGNLCFKDGCSVGLGYCFSQVEGSMHAPGIKLIPQF